MTPRAGDAVRDRGKGGELRYRRGTAHLLPVMLFGLLLILFSGCAGFSPVGMPDLITPEPGFPGGLKWEEIEPGLDYAVLSPSIYTPRIHFVRIKQGSGEESDEGDRLIKPLPPFKNGAGPGEVFEETGAVVIINATPFRYTFGFPVPRREPVGVWIVDGLSYSPPHDDWGVLWCGKGGVYHITEGLPADAEPLWAAGGYLKIIEKGRNVGIHGDRHARTAVGLAEGGRKIYILVVEGEERNLPGLTSRELALFMEKLGVREALNLDGGDSSLLWIEGNSVYRGGRRQVACYLMIRFNEP